MSLYSDNDKVDSGFLSGGESSQKDPVMQSASIGATSGKPDKARSGSKKKFMVGGVIAALLGLFMLMMLFASPPSPVPAAIHQPVTEAVVDMTRVATSPAPAGQDVRQSNSEGVNASETDPQTVMGSEQTKDQPASEIINQPASSTAASETPPLVQASSPVPTPADPMLDKRVAKMESEIASLRSKVAQLEKSDQETSSGTSMPVAHKKTVPRVIRTEKVARRPAVSTEAVVGKSAKTVPVITESKTHPDGSGDVHVLGVTVREGGSFVVLAFGGVKNRYAKGDVVPALGRVTDFGSDNGAPFVDISGVIYH